MKVLKIEIVDWCYYCKYCHKAFIKEINKVLDEIEYRVKE